jgi:cytochrome bd ubiquinol oxidase subunit I
MDVLLLSRLQFGITTVYHFFFVPLTLGLSVLVALMETLYVSSGREVYKQMTRFWGKLFVINFAMGVVTGIVQEFQFGMNWSEYSRFVGDIFGAPLAIEALMAFFLESTFLGIWIFGWDRLSKRVHLAAIWLVAIGSNISALWILIANSFMQEPVGYVINNGRAEMTNFFDLIFNPNVWVMFPHTVSAGLTTGAFFVIGISAYHLLRKNNPEMYKRSFQVAAILGAFAVVLVILNGHSQTQHMVETQPMKIAAAEGLYKTESPASFSLLTIGNLQGTEEIFAIRLPRMLCLLAYNQLDCKIEGINNLQAQLEQTYGPGNYAPPVPVIYWSFRLMVGAGFLMLALAVYAVFLVMADTLERHKKTLRLFVWAIALPYFANTAGWIMTELGRIPWVVYGLMKIEKGVSIVVSGGAALLTLVGFTLIYAALMVATIYLLSKYARQAPPPLESQVPSSAPETVPSMVGA